MAQAIDAETVARVRHDYFRPWKNACPSLGNIRDADCLWVFAFGRNTYTDTELGAEIAKVREKTKGNDLDALKLLNARGLDPGRPNLALAHVAANILDFWKPGIPMIAQFEVPLAMLKDDPQWIEESTAPIIPFWPPADKPYFSTVDGMQECIRISKLRGCSRPAIIAHKAMLVRALAIAWKMGISPIVPEQNVTEFDSRSIQSGPANPKIWLVREIAARYAHHPLHHLVSFTPPTQA
ncbi:MAG TPA: hypothetical protein VFX17_02800 [Patescibacteria group bacterium]|nr:hypothetical protein [Patescibacteria group bacterium]